MVNLLTGAIALFSAASLVSGKAVTFGIARKHSPSAKQAATATKDRATSLKKHTAGNSFAASSTPPTLSLENAQFSYFMPITLGTPPQVFSMVLDTGSAVLWVPDSTCSPVSCFNAQHYFNSTASSTYSRISGNTLQASYGSGSASGHLGTDTLTFGKGAVTITKQEFGQATTQSSITNNGDDGIIGFGPDIASTWANADQTVINTPLTNFVSEKSGYSKMFGIKFESVPAGAVFAQNGLLALGGLPDRSWYTGSISWVPRVMTSPLNYFWSVDIQQVTFGSVKSTGAHTYAIVDTGTTLILIDNSIFNPIYDSVSGSKIDPNSGLWSIPCSGVSSLPDLTFVMNGHNFSLTPSQYILPKSLDSEWGATSSDLCLSYVLGESLSGNGYDMILGQKFLENFVAVYDADNNRVGLAPNAVSSATTTTTTKTTSTKTTTVKATTTTKATTTKVTTTKANTSKATITKTTTTKATTAKATTTKTTTTTKATTTKTTTTTKATTAATSGSCACISGYSGLKNGGGPTGACCTSSDDCRDTCNKDGRCGVSGVIASCTAKSTTQAAGATPTTSSNSSTCKTYKVKAGDKCYLIIHQFNITAKQFYTWNPQFKTDCSNIDDFIGDNVCVSAPAK